MAIYSYLVDKCYPQISGCGLCFINMRSVSDTNFCNCCISLLAGLILVKSHGKRYFCGQSLVFEEVCLWRQSSGVTSATTSGVAENEEGSHGRLRTGRYSLLRPVMMMMMMVVVRMMMMVMMRYEDLMTLMLSSMSK